MASPNPSISWLQAFPILPLLALNTMIQPVGRVLGTSAFHSVWLRASPIICALDTLGFAFRFLTYYTLLRASPRKAMLIIGMDRFNEAEIDNGIRKTTIVATILRLFGFFLGILPPTYVVGAWGDIRWTMAWAWMYAASYVVLEIASQRARRELSELSKPQYTPIGFELEEIIEEPDNGKISHAASTEDTEDEENDRAKLLKDETQEEPEESASTKYKPGRTSREVGDIHDENNDSTADQVEFTASASTEHLLSNGIDGDQRRKDDDDGSILPQVKSWAMANRAGRIQEVIDGSTVAQAETTESTNEGRPSDLESAKNSDSKYADPITSPRLPTLKHTLACMDMILFGWGCLLHAIFLYWAFLDLIQPLLNRHILSSSSWEMPLFLLSLPFIFACLFLIMAGSGGTAWVTWMLAATFSEFANRHLPTSIQKCASTVVVIVTLGLAGLGVVGAYFVLFAMGYLLLSDYMRWVYGLLSVEAVVLLIFSTICFSLYILLKLVAEANRGVKEKLWVSRYVGEDGVVLLTCVLVTFTVSILWYRYRYSSSAHWAQDWRDALVVNTTATNSTMTNTTIVNSTKTS
ncbi:hypothetical protein P152DRAFT_462437 [Eremomyces bilateralis CBS 781.70]|uniref:Uncharacterized protein n=1 Tax=Eremomyces bilateralis CBS 781.70 TaxID=1392243 RepID=A0A6G1FS81_9PEZI|nr:uncharacterized protein P152DRAFT_462437 [Eremomyces bilateralis CBS 781.70]KAF1808578.1 hypothetical protein P152DRAFT_462437 [Eremomyces bilateralis CBS 781.70]